MFGYPGVAVLMFLENLFPPVPSEAIMPFSGFAVARGEMSLFWVVVVGTVASVLGALPLYYLGRLAGIERVEAWIERHGRWAALSRDDLHRSLEYFRRYGGVVVFVGRLVPGIRSTISIPAGISGVSLPVFLLYTTLASALWTWALAFAGYLLSYKYEAVKQFLDPISYAVMGLLAAVFLLRLIRRHGSRRSLSEDTLT